MLLWNSDTPASIFARRRSGGSTSGLAAPMIRKLVGISSGSPAASRPSLSPAITLAKAGRVDVAHLGRAALVGADLDRVAAQCEDGPHAQRPRSQQLRLQGHEVPVARGELKDRLEPLVEQQRRTRDRRHLDRRRRVVGDVDGRHVVPQRASRRPDGGRVGIARRTELGRDREPAGGQHATESGRAHPGLIPSGAIMPTLTAQLVGGPTAVLEYAGLRWLTDPAFSPPGDYEGGLRKTTGPAVAADDVGAIDVVLLSHDHHSDNLDPEGRVFLPRAGRPDDGRGRGAAGRQRGRDRAVGVGGGR